MGVWSQQAYTEASNTGGGDEFGASVWLEDDTLVVGAQWESSSSPGVDGDQTNSDGPAHAVELVDLEGRVRLADQVGQIGRSASPRHPIQRNQGVRGGVES